MFSLTAIIPIYGLERNRENLLRVMKNIPNSIQVIIIHDLSDGEIWDQNFPNWKWPEIQVLEVFGGSPGAVRNFALPYVKGKWLTFWDSDDKPSPTAALRCINEINDGCYEMLIGSYISSDHDGSTSKEFRTSDSPATNFRKFLVDFGIWRCIFLSESLKNVHFSECRIGEDLSFIVEALPSSIDKITFSAEILYEYVNNSPESVTNSTLSEIDFEIAVNNLLKRTIRGNPGKLFKVQAEIGLRVSRIRRFSNIVNLISLLKLCFRHPLASHRKLFKVLND